MRITVRYLILSYFQLLTFTNFTLLTLGTFIYLGFSIELQLGVRSLFALSDISRGRRCFYCR